jgi:hypothetical protein
MSLLFAALSLALAVFMTLGLAGAIDEHREALPMVALMFVAPLVFGCCGAYRLSRDQEFLADSDPHIRLALSAPNYPKHEREWRNCR